MKATALIFNEHEKLSIENPLLKQQIASLEELNFYYIQTDSIQREEIEYLEDEIISNEETIEKLKTSKKKIIYGLSTGGIILFILGLLI